MRCKLINADYFEFLPRIESNSVDLVLIDPPYEVSRKTNFNAGEKAGRDTDRFRLSMDFGTWDRNDFPTNIVDIAEDTFSLSVGIGSADDLRYIAPVHKVFQDIVLRFRTFRDLK